MHILVLPVSGNFFPAQLSMLLQLIEIEYDPPLILGTSGGAVCSILGLGADWSSNSIRRIIQKLNPSLFLKNWWPDPLSFLPSWSLGFFRGSVYTSGHEAKRLFQTYFSEDALTQKEVWIGTTNQTQEKAHFFCNLNKEDSCIDTRCFESHLKIGQTSLCDSLHFLNGNIEEIQKATVASASIPTLVPPVKIGDDLFADGGIFFASPLTPMKDCLQELEDENGLHITYVNTHDIENRKVTTSVDFYPGIFKTGAIAFATMVFSILSQDRLNGLKMLDPDIGNLHRINVKGNKTILKQIFNFRKKCKRSFLELYTKSLKTIDLTDFGPNDIIDVMETVEKEYYCRFWWIGDQPFILSL